MHSRTRKRALFIGAAIIQFAVVGPLTIAAFITQNEIFVLIAIPFGVIAIPILVSLWLSSNALAHDYGLFGTKSLKPLPQTMESCRFITTSGRIGNHFYARGTFQLSCGSEGIVIWLPSWDKVFIERRNILQIIRQGWGEFEIVHSDDQVAGAIIVGQKGAEEIERSLSGGSGKADILIF